MGQSCVGNRLISVIIAQCLLRGFDFKDGQMLSPIVDENIKPTTRRCLRSTPDLNPPYSHRFDLPA
jgi:hypothetical protein